MLEAYLNQTAVYQPKTGDNDRGEAEYGAEVTIPCRKQSKSRFVATATEKRTVTQHIYYVATEVHEGDLLDGCVIASVADWIVLDGQSAGYKAVME